MKLSESAKTWKGKDQGNELIVVVYCECVMRKETLIGSPTILIHPQHPRLYSEMRHCSHISSSPRGMEAVLNRNDSNVVSALPSAQLQAAKG